MAEIWAIVGYKGGIGKSTSAINLGDMLTDLGYRVLVIDGDPQGDATKHLWGTMSEELMAQDPMDLEITLNTLLTNPVTSVKSVTYTNTYGLDLIPANPSLDPTDSSITAPQVRSLFVGIMDEIRDVYDYIIIDTRRSGSRLTQSFLRIANKIIIPMQAASLAMENLRPTIADIELMKQLNPMMEVVGVLPTMIDQTQVSKNVLSEVKNFIVKVEKKVGITEGTYSEKVLPITIKYSTRHEQASMIRVPIRVYIDMLYQNKRETATMLKEKAHDLQHVASYAQLAEMVAFHVPAHLYLPENDAEHDAFIEKAIAR